MTGLWTWETGSLLSVCCLSTGPSQNTRRLIGVPLACSGSVHCGNILAYNEETDPQLVLALASPSRAAHVTAVYAVDMYMI